MLFFWKYGSVCTEISLCISLGLFRKCKMSSYYMYLQQKVNIFHLGHTGPTDGKFRKSNFAQIYSILLNY